MNAVSREEIEQVEKELDAVLEMVQRPVTVKNADNREEAASLQENLQESSQEKSQKNLQERSQESEPVQIEIKKEKKRKRKEDKTNQLIDLLTISYHLFLVYAMFQFDIFLVIL